MYLERLVTNRTGPLRWVERPVASNNTTQKVYSSRAETLGYYEHMRRRKWSVRGTAARPVEEIMVVTSQLEACS
jgi:hypothetical protein